MPELKPLPTVILCVALFAVQAFAQSPADNSNQWPVYRDEQTGFHISYPPDWVVVPIKGRNVRFSVSPRKGAGNCNVVARPNAETARMAQSALNREIASLPTDQASWAEYVGLPPSRVRVFESRRAALIDIPVLVAVVETALENLEGKFTRKQVVALTFTPGLVWSVNCGASTFKPEDARSRFDELRVTFDKVFGSFGFLK